MPRHRKYVNWAHIKLKKMETKYLFFLFLCENDHTNNIKEKGVRICLI